MTKNILNIKVCGMQLDVLRQKFITLNTHIRREKSKINDLRFHLNKLKKEKKTKVKRK